MSGKLGLKCFMQRSIACIDLIRFAAAAIVSISHLLYLVSVDCQNPMHNASGGVFLFSQLGKLYVVLLGGNIFCYIRFCYRSCVGECESSQVSEKPSAAAVSSSVNLRHPDAIIAILGARGSTLANGLVQTTPAEAMIIWLKSITFFPKGRGSTRPMDTTD